MMGSTVGNPSFAGESRILFAYSINHHLASIEEREQLILNEAQNQHFRIRLEEQKSLEEYLLLSTCNRWEMYGVATKTDCLDRTWNTLSEHLQISSSKLESKVLRYRGARMIQHLFEVCSGVDSQMIGETEILGQVKRTFEEARQINRIGACFNRVFPKAFQAAKWVRTHTQIGQGQVSVGNVAVDLAQRIFGELEERRVLLIGGSGKTHGASISEPISSIGEFHLTDFGERG